MADQYNDKTYVRETRTEPSSGGSMALIVGGLVVAVGFILWLVFGGDGPSTVSTDPAADTTNVTVQPTEPADSTTNVTIDADEPAAEPVAPAETAPAEPVETAPAEPAPAEPAEPATNP
jgi:hypothetical protein